MTEKVSSDHKTKKKRVEQDAMPLNAALIELWDNPYDDRWDKL